MNKFNVLVSEVKASLLFASSDESRLLLNGVNFEHRPGKAPIMVATDGRRLSVIETESSQDEIELDQSVLPVSFVVSSAFLKPLCAFAKSQAPTMVVEYHPSKRVVFHLLESHCVVDSEEGAVIEGSYPNWRDIIPSGDKEPVSEMALNSEYVGDFAKACKLLGLDMSIVRVNIFNSAGAMEVQLVGKPNFYGIIMPCKPEPVDRWQPEFLGMNGRTMATLTTGNSSVTLDSEKFTQACNNLADAAKV